MNPYYNEFTRMVSTISQTQTRLGVLAVMAVLGYYALGILPHARITRPVYLTLGMVVYLAALVGLVIWEVKPR